MGTSAFEIELNNLKPNVQVHLVCKKFNKTRISKFTSDHVLVLDICSFNEVEKINWGPLMAVNLERFVALNPQVPFLSLHIPSLKKTNLWPNEVKINTFGLNGLSKKLGWQSQEWVSRLGAYRPHGVLNAVLLYRL